MRPIYIFLLLFSTIVSYAQCNDFIKISQEEFDRYTVVADSARPTPSFFKQDGIVHMPHTTVIFKDAPESENGVLKYVPRGVMFNDIYVLETQDEIRNSYNLIRISPKIDEEIIGFPYIFGKYMLAIEEPHTDYAFILQVWEILSKAKDIKKRKEIALTKCEINNVESAYINNGYVYLKVHMTSNKIRLLKLKI